jgi:DNA (cytosine-5)-methyltransferase 1
LVNYFLEFAEVFQPQTIIMENVAEMKNGFDGVYTTEILERLKNLGYQVGVEVLQSADFGVPQRRKRAFVLANRLGFPVKFPQPTHAKQASNSLFSSEAAYVTVQEAIGDLPTLQHGEGSNTMLYSKPSASKFQDQMRQNASVLYDHFARKLQETQVKRLESIVAGQGARDLPLELRPKSHYSGAYGRLSWDDLAPTITRWVFHPGSGRFSHPVDTRTITIREAARLQSFSDDFVFTGSYIQKSHQVGNAVPPLLMKSIAAVALEWLQIAYARENLAHSNVLVALQNETLVGAD